MRLFYNLSIKYKIMSIAILAIVGFSVSFIENFSVAQKNSRQLERLETVVYPIMARSEKNQVALDIVINLLDQAVAVEEQDFIEEADAVIVVMKKAFAEIAKMDSSKSKKAKQLQSQLDGYYNLAKLMTAGMLSGTLKADQIQAKAKQMQGSLKIFQDNFEQFQKDSKLAFTDIISNTVETAQFSILLSAIIGAVLVFVLAMIAYLIAGSITRNILNVSENLREIANGDGDLTQRLSASSNDEVGQLVSHFNTFMDKLQTMIQELTGYSSHVGSAAEELTNIAQESKEGIESQRAEAEQVATASNEMSATIVEVARNAEQAASAATSANDAATDGSAVVSKTIGIINQLADDVGAGSGAVNQLRDDSESIGSVLDVIRGIAEQTNLLALNAAIEAARAGEQGRGFAVVADEVRTLASRTQESTKEIQTMIEKLQSSAGQASEIMSRSQSTSEQGVAEAAHAGEALDKITESVSVINNMNEQIASAAEEQSVVAAEIDQNIINISQSADVNAENIGQLANAGSSLNNVAIQMQELVGQFKV
ncbi:Methyl-accepting chemotaxis sensor/transducer protein [hydrothermal vent metagenome]|uniref:Methyl-accepting chemotaxis sensor/transducer protein n=1 Tax=hydrothermal vent metagenome TaxID=652676 RepID=A0A3B1A7I9_9ZZZZ